MRGGYSSLMAQSRPPIKCFWNHSCLHVQVKWPKAV